MWECTLAQLASCTNLYHCIVRSRWVGPEGTEANRYDMYEKRLHTHRHPCCLDSILFPIRATSLRSLSAIEIDTIAWSHFPLRKESYIHPQIILYLILGITTFFSQPWSSSTSREGNSAVGDLLYKWAGTSDIPTVWYIPRIWAILKRSTGIKSLLLYKFRAGIWHYPDCSCSTCQPSATLGSFQRFTTDDDLGDWLDTWLFTVAV